MTYKKTIYFEDIKPYGKPYYLLIGQRPITAELQDYIDNPAQFEQDKKDWEQEIKRLEKERDEAHEARKKQLNVNTALADFLKNDLGFANLGEGKAFLNGEKLPDIINKLKTKRKESEKDKVALKKHNEKLKGDITIIQKFLTKWGVSDLVNLNLKLDGWSKFPVLNKRVNELLDKESVADIKELDDKIKNIKQLQQTTATERDNARTKRDEYKTQRDELRQKVNNVKPSWDHIVDKVNKRKTVIIGDLQKKKIRHHMAVIAGEFAWTVPNVNEDSGEE